VLLLFLQKKHRNESEEQSKALQIWLLQINLPEEHSKAEQGRARVQEGIVQLHKKPPDLQKLYGTIKSPQNFRKKEQ
jgi:hypothetical protein